MTSTQPQPSESPPLRWRITVITAAVGAPSGTIGGDWNMQRPEILFDRWYVQPLKALECIPNGDGAFIALATCCFLYERYATAVIKSSPAIRKATKNAKISQLAKDFEVDEQTARFFWKVIRDGILHGAMPKQRQYGDKTLPRWKFRHDFSQPMELTEHNGRSVLKVQPWLFAEKVLSLWRENMDLLEQSDSFPWASISLLPF